ncbi:MAG: sulfite exporter TauE/SafE family protein [Thermoleophilia bacterium]|nr:sulfite exporter TauE/SafE family protein [Thermoleophilia bacterium]
MEQTGSNTQRSGGIARLSAIGIAGGVFSGLFGVGGGTVIVPLLVLWRGLNEKLATGTSLLAIVIVASFAAAGSAIFGDVDLLKGALIGVPAIGGVLAGTALQQRLSDRVLAGLFALLAFAIAVVYLFRGAG